MLALIIGGSYALGYVVTGRVAYAFGRHETIVDHGLAAYPMYEERVTWWSHALAFVFPLTWVLAVFYGLLLVANFLVTCKPYRGPAEKQELLKQREADIERRERELGMR